MRAKSPLPPQSLQVLEYLRNMGSRTQREIIEELNLPTRTVRYSIRRLLEKDFIVKQPNLNDMRSVYYAVSPDLTNFDEIVKKEFAHV